MTDTAEQAAAPQDVPSVVIAAFGVSFAIADDIPLPELLGRPPSPDAVWTWVREDPAGVEERWDAGTAHRVREQRRGERDTCSGAPASEPHWSRRTGSRSCGPAKPRRPSGAPC